MPYRYEWQQFYGQPVADLLPGGSNSRDALYSLLSEANTYVLIGDPTKAICLYEDFTAAAYNSKLEGYIPIVERQMALLAENLRARQHVTLDREWLHAYLHRLEQQTGRGPFNAVRGILGLPQISVD